MVFLLKLICRFSKTKQYHFYFALRLLPTDYHLHVISLSMQLLSYPNK
jgi:hypothetical protein